jgi:hypothetical protein
MVPCALQIEAQIDLRTNRVQERLFIAARAF